MTLFTLDINKRIFKFLLLSIFCFIFTTVYNKFGHGVYSVYMNTLFIWPLIAAITYTTLKVIDKGNNKLGIYLFNTSIVVMIYGSLLVGIFEIAGTASTYTNIYFILGAILFVIGFIILIVSKKNHK